MVDRLDTVLRHYYGVREYTESADCVLRIALANIARPVRLTDGTVIEACEAVGDLHFWNEHLPPFPASGPDLHWAKVMRTRIRYSLELLCIHIQRDPAWQNVNAIRANAPLPFRPRARQQLLQLARRHGFERGEACDEKFSLASALSHNLLLWAFVRAYNPSALMRFSLRQERQILWLSRRSLLERYGDRAARGDSGVHEGGR